MRIIVIIQYAVLGLEMNLSQYCLTVVFEVEILQQFASEGFSIFLLSRTAKVLNRFEGLRKKGRNAAEYTEMHEVRRNKVTGNCNSSWKLLFLPLF